MKRVLDIHCACRVIKKTVKVQEPNFWRKQGQWTVQGDGAAWSLYSYWVMGVYSCSCQNPPNWLVRRGLWELLCNCLGTSTHLRSFLLRCFPWGSIQHITPCNTGTGICLISLYPVALTVVLVSSTSDSGTLVPRSRNAVSKCTVYRSSRLHSANH